MSRKLKLWLCGAACVLFWMALVAGACQINSVPQSPTSAVAIKCTGETFDGNVVSVSDGDTLDVLRAGKAVRVRLSSVDAPEKAQAFGQKAKQFTSELVFGKSVSVCIVDADRYGRTVGLVSLPDGRSLNRELVANGFAWWYRRYSNVNLEKEEQSARAARRGLWADTDPTPPWEWRKERRQ